MASKPKDQKPATKTTKGGKNPGEEASALPPVTGSGRFYFDSGALYEGQWICSQEDVDLDGGTATGQKRHGRGTYTEGVYQYAGQWAGDKQHGQGKFCYASGNYYEGEWAAGEYCGLGKFSWPDGRQYEGTWAHNKPHGQGTYTSADGHQWTGQFFNGAGPGLTCQL